MGEFVQAPDSMLFNNGKELLFNGLPQLTSLKIFIAMDVDEDEGNEDAITTLALDLPCLEVLDVENGVTLKTCRATCPKLVTVRLQDCNVLTLPPSLMSQLKNITAEVRVSNSHA